MSRVSATAPRKGLLHGYSARLTRMAEHARADAAMVEAHRERTLAELSRIDLLKVQARDPEKSEFFVHMLVAHMSHELRTPLNAIIGFSDLLRLFLKRQLPADTKLHSYVDDINTAGQHLLRIINDILDYSKIEAGKLDLNAEEFDFAEMAKSCARMTKGLMDEKQITLVSEIPDGLHWLHADELKLKQVLINLLSNAVKFTPPNGTVTMGAALEPNGSFLIEITDTGIGIAAEDIQRVFTPFTQLNAEVRPDVKGTGLGLPLARALVQLHGGTLAMTSALGKGTTVTVRLPASRIFRRLSAPADDSYTPRRRGSAGAIDQGS